MDMLLIAMVVVLLLVLMYWAWSKCWLLGSTRFAKKGCPNGKGSFCGAAPDPGAMSEAAGLYELGARMEGFCGSTPAPAAMAEAQGLMQMGWRPEHMKTRPSCAPPHPSAISEAQSLQHANALRPGSPYYSSGVEGFTGHSGCGGVSPEAAGEEHLLQQLQALDDPRNDVDAFAAQKLRRDRAAFSSTVSRSEELRSNPGQISARRARLDSMREGFGGPAEAGFGWSPTDADVAASPASGGWGDAQTAHAATCVAACMDGCGGTNCHDHCMDQCRTAGLIAATGQY